VPQAGVLAGPDPVLDPGVRPVPGLQERQLPTQCVGGERLIAVAVADLEGVQRRTRVRELAADDDAHVRAAAGPAGQVQQAGDLDDVGVLTQVPVGVAGFLPRPLRKLSDGVPDGVGDGVAD